MSPAPQHEKEGQLQAGQDITSEDEDLARSVSPPEMKEPVNSPYYRWGAVWYYILYIF